MDVVTQKFIEDEIKHAHERRRRERKEQEEKYRETMWALEGRISKATFRVTDVRQALRDHIYNKPEGPWSVHVRLWDGHDAEYSLPGFNWAEDYVTGLVNKYHSNELKRMFPTSTGWRWKKMNDNAHSHQFQHIAVDIPSPPEPDLIDMSTPCPFGLSS